MKARLLVVLLAATLVPSELFAQEPEAVRVTEQGVLVDFQDADLRLVVTALAEAGNLNLLYSELPTRRVTLRMRQPVSRENILPLLRSLAQSNGLKVIQEGDFLRLEAVVGAGQAVADTTEKESEELRLFVYRLKHARAAQLGGTLQTIFGGNRGESRSGLRQVPLSESLRQPERPEPDSGVQVVVDVGAARVSLPGQLKGEVQIVNEEATNSLLVRALPSDWEIIRQAIETLDLRPLQVLIEVVIAEVRRNSESGISVSGTVADARNGPTVKGTLTGGIPGNFALQILRAGGLDVNLALATLASRGEVRVLSRPVILAQNNQEARILIGSERPFIQVSRSLPTDNAARDQVIQYRDVGTKLTIIPTINDDGYVNLQVLQEVSTATAETQFGAPIISTREAATHLFVRNGQTAVIGGLIDRQEERTKSGIPVLMEIPIIGALFGSTRKTSSTSELFLFLTPYIIASDTDMDGAGETVRSKTPLLDGVLNRPDSTASPAPDPTVPR